MKQGGASSRRRGLELGWSLPSRGPLARVDILTRLARTADTLGYSVVTISDHIVLPTSSSEPYPYDKAGAFPGGADQVYLEPIALAAWLLAATRRLRVAISVLVVPLPQSGRHREAARHHRRPLRRAPHRGCRGRLVARGVRGAGRPALRGAGCGHRRVHPADEGALDRGLAALRGQVLSSQGHHDAAAPGPEATPADLGRRTHRAGAPPDGPAG